VRYPVIAAAALAAAALASAAQADTAKDYNLFVLHNMNMPSSDVEGRVAVGGDANISSYSVGTKSPSSGVNFVVGGNLNAQGSSANGKVVVAGTTNTSYAWNNILPSTTPIPVNFNAEAARLGNLSTMLDGYANTGTVKYVNYGGAHGTQTSLVGSNAGLNVFDLDGAKLTDTNTFTITLKPGSTALINVSGTSDLWSNAGLTIIGGDASSILWNFTDATTLGFSGMSFLGSVLAPNANYLGGWGQINGQMIVGSFSGTNGSTQVNKVSFAGDLLGLTPTTGAVPEPAVWVMMVGGFGLVGAMLRRRRRSAIADFA
jgi:choice-of-anchor A domain-containing protein